MMMDKLRNKVSLVIVLTILMGVALGCGGGDPVPPQYQGNWEASDGSTVYMDGDGKAGFKIGGKSVEGGGAVLDEGAKTITISLFGISETFKIDAEPSGGEMTLNGKAYKKR